MLWLYSSTCCHLPPTKAKIENRCCKTRECHILVKFLWILSFAADGAKERKQRAHTSQYRRLYSGLQFASTAGSGDMQKLEQTHMQCDASLPMFGSHPSFRARFQPLSRHHFPLPQPVVDRWDSTHSQACAAVANKRDGDSSHDPMIPRCAGRPAHGGTPCATQPRCWNQKSPNPAVEGEQERHRWEQRQRKRASPCRSGAYCSAHSSSCQPRREVG
jgi:hypothetical protein